MLADHASTRDGLLYIIGGGINQAIAAEWPAPFPVSLGAILDLAPDEIGEDKDPIIKLKVAVRRRRDRQPFATMTGELRGSLAVGEDPIVKYAIALNLRPIMIPEADRYTVEITVSHGKHRGRVNLPFDMRAVPEG